MERKLWSTIPHPVLVEIFTYLSIRDRFQASLVCKWWSESLLHPILWRKVELKFDVRETDDINAAMCVEKYCHMLKDLDLSTSVIDSESRTLAFLDTLSSSPKRNLKKFSFRFTGLNPLMFKGDYVLATLKQLLSQNIESKPYFRLTVLDLNKCNVPFDDKLITILVDNHPLLRVARLQNLCLVDGVTSSSMQKLVENCLYLEELQTFYHCIDRNIIKVLATPERRNKFKYLSLLCLPAVKYKDNIPSETWKRFTDHQVLCEVEIKFSPSCIQRYILPILSPEIQLARLHLSLYENFREIMNHIKTYYFQTIRHLTFFYEPVGVLLAPVGFELELVNLLMTSSLTELVCDYILSEPTINIIIKEGRLVKYKLWSKGRHGAMPIENEPTST